MNYWRQILDFPATFKSQKATNAMNKYLSFSLLNQQMHILHKNFSLS